MPLRTRPELDPATAQLVEHINTAIREATLLLRTLSEQRTVIFRQLRAEGWKVTELAELAGISPQRMSKILDPQGHAGRRVGVAVTPWDGWV